MDEEKHEWKGFRYCCKALCNRYVCEYEPVIEEDEYLLFPHEPNLKPLRPCTKEEQFRISYSKILCGFILTYIFLLQARENIDSLQTGVNLELSTIFFNFYSDCFIEENTNFSINETEKYISQVEDYEQTFCVFKNLIILFNFMLLLPVVFESLNVIGILMISMTREEVIVSISGGEYVGYDNVITECHSGHLCKRAKFSIFGGYVLCRKLCRNEETTSKRYSLSWWLFLSILSLLPDLILSLLLYPLSFYLLIQRDTLESIIISFVAVQFFARIDDEIVHKIFFPRRSTGAILSNYLKPHEDAKIPYYRPLREFWATSQSYNFGLLQEEQSCSRIRGFYNWLRSRCEEPPVRRSSEEYFRKQREMSVKPLAKLLQV
eukprot:snap_masked-scaffold_6-processed-gene-10.13-mRNA-1 protein AED:1.00 eAED:1.00 QI:0/0/0/0/1/1/2/0/376